MTPKLRPCDEATIAGRLRKAEQFMDAAETIRELAGEGDDVGDAYVTLCVHAGVAAADVLCCIALGEYAHGDDHNAAVAHLTKVRPDGRDLGNSLRTLLSMKTRAGYSHQPVSATQLKRAQRAAERLLNTASQRRIGA
jgi:hypothetical protein